MTDYIEKAQLREQEGSEFLRAAKQQSIVDNQPNVDAFNEAINGQEKEVRVSFDDAAKEQKTEPESDNYLKQAAGGSIDAVNEFLQATDEMSSYLQSNNILPDLGVLQIYNEKGELDLDYISTQQKIDKGLTGFQLPTVSEPKTTSGSIVRGISQFVTGFIPAMKATRVSSGVNAADKVRRTIAAAALTDFTFFDPHEERLSDFLRDNFELRDPVTKYLASDKTDSSVEGRFKNVLEGLGVEAATAGIFMTALKGYKAMRKVKDSTQKDLDGMAESGAIDQVTLKDEPAADIFKVDGKELITEAPTSKVMAERGGVYKTTSGPIEGSAGLSPEHSIIEANLAKKVGDNFEQAKIEYNNIPDTDGGRIINTDSARELSPEYLRDRTLSAAVQEPASWFVKKLYAQKLAEPALPGQVNEVLFTAGGTGSGKSNAVKTLLRDESNKAQIVYDANMDSVESAVQKITQAIDAGKKVKIAYVYRDPVEALVNGALARATRQEAKYGTGRTVPIQKHIDTHIGSLETIKQLAEKYKNNPNVQIDVIDNSYGKDGAKYIDIDKLPGLDNNKLYDQAIEAINKEHQAGRISDATRRGFAGKLDSGAAGLEDGQGLGAKVSGQSQSKRPQQRDDLLSKSSRAVEETGVDDSLFDVSVPVGKKAYNVNLARIKTTDDIKKIIENTGKVLDPDVKTKINVDVTAATRGVQSNEQTKLLADDLGMSVDDLLSRRKGQAFNAEQAVASRNLLVASATNLEKLAKRVKSLEATDTDRLALRKAMDTHVAIQKEVSGLTAEAGRALQSFNIQAKSKKEQLRQINDFLTASGGRGRVDEIADTLINLSDKGASAAQKNRAIDKLSRATTFDMVYEVWINSILSGPITHIVNTTSNATVALYRIPERAVQVGIGKALGNADARFGEVGALSYGLAQGLVDGFRLAKEAYKTDGMLDPLTKVEAKNRRSVTAENISKSSVGRNVVNPVLKVLDAKTLDEGGFAARFADGLGTTIRFPGRMLATEDAFFKGLNYRMEVNANAFRQATREGLDGKAFAERMAELIDNPPDFIRSEALDKANINTFTNSNQFARRLGAATDALPVSKFIIPFTNTPANLVKFSFERTPLAPLGKTFRDDIAAGGFRRDEALAKATTGSAMMVAFGWLASEGIITGSGPSDMALKNVKNKVLPPNSIKVGDKYYSYRRTDPLGMLIGISADMTYLSQEMDEAEFSELSAAVTLSIMNNVLSKTWLTGVSDFMEAVSTPVNVEGAATQNFQNYFDNLGASFVPNALRQANVNLVDPYMREASGMVAKAMTKIPGFSDNLPLKRDIWGEPRLYNLVDKAEDDPVMRALAEKNIGVSTPKKIISWNGAATRLTDEEYSRFVEISRQPAKKALDNINSIETMDKEQLEKIVDRILADTAKAGKARLLKEFPEILDRIEEERDSNVE